jgi:hypothetical protein
MMAAHRQNVPVRQESGIFEIEDGTMCRMPSPLPGPLRGQIAVETQRSAVTGDSLQSRTRAAGRNRSSISIALGHAA